MTKQTQESLRELSTEVVNIQETTRKAEKRIGELTASSLQGISTAMETGMKQFQSSTKEIKEVLSAEISARRNAGEKTSARMSEMELREEARINDLGEQVGARLNAMQEQVDAIPAKLEAVTKDCKDFATYAAPSLYPPPVTSPNLTRRLLQVRVRQGAHGAHPGDGGADHPHGGAHEARGGRP